MNWFFACWCKFRKTKSNFNDFWVDVVKIGRGHLVHETLKSAEWVYKLSLFFACWLWCNNFWLRPTLYSISLTLKCQFTAVRPPAVAGRILWNSVCPSLPPDICVGVFLKFDHYSSLNFGMVPETFKKLCITTWFCGKTILAPKIVEVGQK